MSEDFPFPQLERLIENFYGESERIARYRKISSGLFNTTYDIKLKRNGSVILRIAPPEDYPQLYYEKGMMADEPAIHEMVLSRTTVPAPEVYLYDPSRAIFPRDYILMEKKEGRPLDEIWDSLGRDIQEKILRQLGRYTAELHSIHGRIFGYARTLPVMEPQRSWRRAFVIMLDRILADCRLAGGFSEGETNILMTTFLQNEKYLEKKIPPSFLHLDIWQQNILVDEKGKITAILDFDRVAWGDTELEFAVLDICGLSRRAFFEGYGQFRPGDQSAIRRNALYVIFEFLKYVFTNRTRRSGERTANYFKGEIFRLVKNILLHPDGALGA